MFVTLYALYRALAYLLGHLWRLASAMQLGPALGLVKRDDSVAVMITYHPRTEQHVGVDIVMYICTLIVLFNVVRFVLVGKKAAASHAPLYARSYHTSLKQTNDALEMAREAIEQTRNDFKEMEGMAVTSEILLELNKVRRNAQVMHVALGDLMDVLDKQARRRLFAVRSVGPSMAG